MPKLWQHRKNNATNHPAWLDEQLHVKRYRVAATSLCGGKSLKELNLHRRYNVFVLEIQNGSQILPIPSGSAAIYAGSQLLLTGTPRQLQNFELAIQSYDMQILPLATDNQQTLHQFLADPKHGAPLTSVTRCRSTGIRRSAAPRSKKVLTSAMSIVWL